MIIMRNI